MSETHSPISFEEALRDAREDDDLIPTIQAALKEWFDAIRPFNEELTDEETVLSVPADELRGAVHRVEEAINKLDQYGHHTPYYRRILEEM